MGYSPVFSRVSVRLNVSCPASGADLCGVSLPQLAGRPLSRSGDDCDRAPGSWRWRRCASM